VTKAEAIEHIYNTFPYAPAGAPEDFVDWALRQEMPLDDAIGFHYGACYAGVFHSLDAYAHFQFGPDANWEMLVEMGYWQGDRSEVVFEPLSN